MSTYPHGTGSSLAVSLTGVVLVVIGGAEVSGASFAGDLLAIGAALTWAAYAVMLRPLFKHYSASRISSTMIVWGGIMLIPFALPETLSQDWSNLGPKSIAAWFYSDVLRLDRDQHPVLPWTALNRRVSSDAVHVSPAVRGRPGGRRDPG